MHAAMQVVAMAMAAKQTTGVGTYLKSKSNKIGLNCPTIKQ